MSLTLGDFRAREEQLRRLDAQLNEKKNEVVRRAEELVRQQAERLARSEHTTPSVPSYDHHTFDAEEAGFLDETTGYRGAIQTAGGSTTAERSRPSSSVPSAAAAAPRSYSRPVSAATQDGRRRSSAIPQPAAAAAFSSNTPAARAASASRITPSSLSSSSFTAATAAPASRPQSRARAAAPPVDSYSRQSSYDDAEDAPAADEFDGADDGAGDGVSAADAGLDGLDLPSSALGSAATIRFQKARLQALTASVAALTTALSDRDKELADLKLLVKNGNDSREKLLRAKESSEKSQSQSAKQLAELASKLAHAEGEAATMRRDVVGHEKRRKELEADAKARDFKLNRCLSEMERLKEQLARVKSTGGGGGGANDQTQKDLSSLRIVNKKLLQQRADLLAGFKKQQKLIEVLKKQKLHMELAKMLHFTEEEFAKSLEMGEI